MKKMLALLAAAAVFSVCAGEVKKPKYVFLFIGDGMSTPQRMVAEEFARKTGYGHIVFNMFPFHATTRTCSASSLVTDSAASGTAIACGAKTTNGRIGTDPDGKRLESSAEVAHKNGKKVGIVTSVTMNHATPASFYAHRNSRGELYAIGLDLLDSGFEYFGGGGLDGHSNDKDNALYRGDIYELAAKNGYKVICGNEGFKELSAKDGKVFARVCEGMIPYSIDGESNLPTLEDYTRKGIELLDNPNGFFMMVEGGSIDWCGHANDAASNMFEILALDRAVRVAVEFSKQHPEETLIIVTGDHETGGMTMGFAGSGYAMYMERLVNQKCSIGKFDGILKEAKKKNPDFNFENACELLHQYFGFEFNGGKNPMAVSDGEKAALEKAFKDGNLPNQARILMSNKAGIGWTSGSHTALPVLTTATGPGAEIFQGFIDNSDIAILLKTLL